MLCIYMMLQTLADAPSFTRLVHVVPMWSPRAVSTHLDAHCVWQGSEYEVFSSLARDIDDVDFFETTSAEAAKAANISARPPTFIVGSTFPGFQQHSTPSVVRHIHPRPLFR